MVKYKIAISGKANSGKNTLANLLTDKLNCDIKLMAFADPIKKIVMTMFPQADENCLYGTSGLRDCIIPNSIDENGNPLSYRKVLCDIGTQARKYNDNIWVNVFDAQLKNIATSFNAIIATDARFREEIDYLKSNNFYLIRLYRNIANQKTLNHISETGQSQINDKEFDYVLHNDKSLEELNKEIDRCIMPNILA